MTKLRLNKEVCNICHCSSNYVFSKKVLKKYVVAYYQCQNCGYVQTERPHWLQQAYKSPINHEDTGLVSRNLSLSSFCSFLILIFFNKKGVFLDYAGGYGLLTRLMRDIGIDYHWEDQFCTNLLSPGFVGKEKRYELISAFEVFEHIQSPMKDIKKIFTRTDSLLFSTQIIPKKSDISKWAYIGNEHGQHISFYSVKSLKVIARKLNLNLYTDKSMIHLLTRKKLNGFLFFLVVKLRSILGKFPAIFFSPLTMSDHIKMKKRKK